MVALSAALIAGCGGDSQPETEGEAPAGARSAVAEVGKTRAGLREALAMYQAGDAKAADTQVGDTYLEHFELVEAPLEAQDAVLTESLEDAIREELRDKLQARAPEQEVAELVKGIEADLDRAEAALR